MRIIMNIIGFLACIISVFVYYMKGNSDAGFAYIIAAIWSLSCLMYSIKKKI